jgi:hypothetical protein
LFLAVLSQKLAIDFRQHFLPLIRRRVHPKLSVELGDGLGRCPVTSAVRFEIATSVDLPPETTRGLMKDNKINGFRHHVPGRMSAQRFCAK